MWYVFHGEDELSRSEAILQLKHKMDPVVGELNTTTLDGRGLALGELRAACDAVPFMSRVRLVIVSDLASSRIPGKPARRKRAEPAANDDLWRDLGAYLPQLPESTRLVLSEAQTLPETHRLLGLGREHGGHVRAFAVPVGAGLEQWVRRRAEAKGVAIAPSALTLLATYIGSNLRLL
ncbi:MAG TPA: hypothetical protein PLB78_17605, partial [Anaerolineae bacterium]|nr:hypothetical protein [Anaerolineae bacterium]